MLSSLSIRSRINILSAIAAAGALLVAALSLMNLDATMRSDIATKTRNVTESAQSIVAYYGAQEQAGQMSRADAQAAAMRSLRALRYGKDDYVFITDMQARMLMHPMQPKLDGTDVSGMKDAKGEAIFVKMADVVRTKSAGFVRYEWQKPDDGVITPKISYVKGYAPWGWVIGTGVYTDDVARVVGQASLKLGGAALAVVMVMLGGGWLLARSITRPMARIVERTKGLAAGDQETEIPFTERGDEVGQIASSLAEFRRAALERARLEKETNDLRAAGEAERAKVAEERRLEAEEDAKAITELGRGLAAMAQGDLTHRVEAAFAPKTEPLKANFNQAMARLEESMVTVVQAAHTIGSGAGEISQASDDLSRRTEQQAASLEETAAALDEITTTVKRTAEGAMHARKVVLEARDGAERNGEIVATAIKAMGEIEESAKQINQIIGVIDEIAFQTNLLALNAGVEAARAGEAGKGFAVVATEVRALAQRSAEAAKDIKSLIGSSSEQVSRGVDLVARAGQVLEEIVGQVSGITDIVAEIAASAQEQSTGLAEVNTAMNQMDQVTQQNAAMVEESTAASHGLANEAAELARLMAQFTTHASRGGVVAQPARPAAPPRAQAYASAGATARKVEPQAVAADDDWEEF
ncbi:methyl-accepting chemotaxis protein [Phenylobacterium sp.]|uniref:methyl-accepting chemotaxis protein n=1 Tax=Phenylobacterium sp. TaxID=1871053 RepID=UPI0035B10C4A